jgi:hypothetical protein
MSASTLGYTIYAAIGALMLLWGVYTHLRRPRFVTLDAIVARMMRHPFWRWAVWAAWAFVGWHSFVRGRGAFK